MLTKCKYKINFIVLYICESTRETVNGMKWVPGVLVLLWDSWLVGLLQTSELWPSNLGQGPLHLSQLQNKWKNEDPSS